MVRGVVIASIHRVLCGICVATASGVAAAGAEQMPESKAIPIIQVSLSEHDFGAVWIGPNLEHTFTITNVGHAVLEITKVDTHCGCTVAGEYPGTLAPGKSGAFPFVLNTKVLRGSYAKDITIHSNDPATPQAKLTLKGEVKRYIEVTPSGAYFGSVGSDTCITRVVTITSSADTPLKLALDPFASMGAFRFALIEKVPGREFDLMVNTIPPFDNAGQINETATIMTNLEAERQISVRAVATIRERLSVSPEAITISPRAGSSTAPAGAASSPVRGIVTVTNTGLDPVMVTGVSVDDAAIEAGVHEQQAGQRYLVEVNLPSNFVLPAQGRMLTIRTDDVQKPEIRVPIRSSSSHPTARSSGPRPAEQLIGQPAPAFSLTTVGGKKISNKDLGDSITVLDFFAVNCGFCKKQVPRVEEIRKLYGPKGVRFVNVSQKMGKTAYTQEQIVTHTRELGSQAELAIDDENEVGKSFKAFGFPTMVILGKSGKVEAVNVGNVADLETRMKTQLDALLKQG
jgi:thiol-disulfide isomerase/thioredoxin